MEDQYSHHLNTPELTKTQQVASDLPNTEQQNSTDPCPSYRNPAHGLILPRTCEEVELKNV